MTTYFYTAPTHIRGDRLILVDDEARHASKVLRASSGDEVVVVDGEGGWYRVELGDVGGRNVAGHVVETRRDVGEPPYDLTIGIGLVKHRGRFETFLEKAVELGVTEIVPLITERTEKEGLRRERSEKILIAAMKQSGRSRLPTLRQPCPLDEFVQAKGIGLGICCHESADRNDELLGVLQRVSVPRGIRILVGPEGGFTDAEVGRAREADYSIVSLGARRLRAETAAIVAAAAVALAYRSASA